MQLFGATYHVAPSGNNSSPGSATQPFQTIAKGVSLLRPGDTLLVHAGTYAETFSSIPAGSSWSSPVTIKAFENDRPVIRPASGADRVFTFTSPQSYIVVDGFILDAVNVVYDAVKITSGAHHIRLQNCEVMNSPNQGILMTTQFSGNNELINLDIHHNGRDDFDHGVYISTSNNLVDKCRIHHNAGWGVHVYSGEPYNHSNVIRNNRLYDNAQKGRGPGIGFYAGTGQTAYNNIIWNNNGGIILNYGASNAKVFNNTIFKSRASGILVGEQSSSDHIANNIISQSVGYGILVESGSQNSTVQNNLLYANNSGAFRDSGGKTTFSSNLSGTSSGEDPKFVNSSAFDFHLLSSSPAIARGLILPEVTIDFDGVVRPRVNACAIGAYELASSEPVVNSPPTAQAKTYSTSEDVAVPTPLTGTDPDGDTLQFVITTNPTRGNLSGSAPNLSYTPARDFAGQDTFSYLVRDSKGAQSAAAQVSINVQAVNDPPNVSAGPDQAITLPGSATLGATVTDPDNPTLTFNWKQVSGPGPVVLANPAGLTTTAAFSAAGTYLLEFGANDGSLAASDQVQVVVNPAGTPPPPPPPTNSFVKIEFEAESGTIVAPMAVSPLAAPSQGSFVSTSVSFEGTVTYSFDVSTAGQYVVWCRLLSPTDVTDSFFVSIDNGPEDVFDMAENRWSNEWQWNLVNGRNGGAVLSLNPRVFDLATGRHTLRFRGREAKSAIDKLIIVNDRAFVPSDSESPSNTAPVAQNDIYTATEDQVLTIPAPGVLANDTDAENSPLTAQISAAPASGSVTLQPNGALTYTPKANFFGTDSFTYTVRDTNNASSANSTVSITVKAINDAPVVFAGQDVTTTLPTGAALSGTATDPDNTSLTLRWSMISGPGPVAFSSSGALKTTASFSQPGTYIIQLSASDSLLTTTDQVQVIVNPASTTDATSVTVEAESGRISSPMVAGFDARASGGRYVYTTSGGRGVAAYTFTVPTSGQYVIWCRVLGVSGTKDSFYVSVDGGPEDVFDMAENRWSPDWQWTVVNGRGGTSEPLRVNPRVFMLSAGTHSIVFRGREISSGLDKFVITSDRQFAPAQAPIAPVITQEEPGISIQGSVAEALIRITGLPPGKYRLQTTVQLDGSVWRTAAEFEPASNGSYEFTETNAGALSHSFYRVIAVPGTP